MPQVFKVGSYWVYFWANENEPLEPIHVHVAQGAKQSSAKPSTKPRPKGISAPYRTAQPPAKPTATAASLRAAGRSSARRANAAERPSCRPAVTRPIRSVIKNSPLSGGVLLFCAPRFLHIL